MLFCGEMGASDGNGFAARHLANKMGPACWQGPRATIQLGQFHSQPTGEGGEPIPQPLL